MRFHQIFDVLAPDLVDGLALPCRHDLAAEVARSRAPTSIAWLAILLDVRIGEPLDGVGRFGRGGLDPGLALDALLLRRVDAPGHLGERVLGGLMRLGEGEQCAPGAVSNVSFRGLRR
jgi:hypothetical protein